MMARRLIFVLIIGVVLVYGFFVAHGVLFPVPLSIVSPQDGAVISGSRVEIMGLTDPEQDVWIDGKVVKSDKEGYFSSTHNLFPGYNEIGISVTNRFNKETKKSIQLFAQ